mgnify:CR=1 FL=1
MIHMKMPITYEWRGDRWWFSEDLGRSWKPSPL